MVTVAYRPGLLFQSGAGEIWPRKPPPLSGEQSDKKQKSEKTKSKNRIKKSRNFDALVPVWGVDQGGLGDQGDLGDRGDQGDQGVQSPFLWVTIRQKQKSEKGVQAELIKWAGTFHSTSERKENIFVLALPIFRFSWNFYQIISCTKYE